MSLLLEGKCYCPHFREEVGVYAGEEVASQPVSELMRVKLHETQQRQCNVGGDVGDGRIELK